MLPLITLKLALTIGAFGPAMKMPYKRIGAQGLAGFVAPTSSGRAFLACAEGHKVHFFLHRDLWIDKCLWADATSQESKAKVFHDLREWVRNAKKEIRVNFTEAADVLAWYAEDANYKI